MGIRKWAKKYWYRWLGWLDNHNFKTKLIFMYIFCVLIPVLLTNTLIIKSAMDSDRAKRERQLDAMAESIIYSMNSTMEKAVTAMRDIYTNREITKFLETDYGSPLAYYSAYGDLSPKSLMHTKLGQNIANITAYADNETLVNGGEFFRLEAVAAEEWYQDYVASNKDLLLYSYFDDKKMDAFGYDSKRTISVIRKLNFYGNKNCQKLIKLDIDYITIARDIISANYDAYVYICAGDKILFDNQGNPNRGKEYELLTDDIKKNANVKRILTLYGSDWDIYIVSRDAGVLRYLLDSTGVLIALILVNMLLPLLVMFSVNRSMSKRILVLGEHLHMVKDEEFMEIKPVEGKDEIGILIGNYNLMVSKIKELIEVVYKDKLERQELSLSKQQAELLALHSQINPHFMFNALESIRMRSFLKEEEETADIIGKLAILMRKSTDWGADYITISDEMQFAEAYLQLQKYRFGDKLSYRIQVEEELHEVRIPKLTIVTFVENSCVHGIEGMCRPGWVFVNVNRNGDDLVIEIEDTGTGMSDDFVGSLLYKMQNADIEMLETGKSVGIVNACIRLQHYSGGQVRYEIESEENVGTTITIRMKLPGQREE